MRIAYSLNSRVPSNHAHVIQTLNMCNGFAADGHDVILFHPAREQRDSGPETESISEYYDIPVAFERDVVPYIDANTVLKRLFGRTFPQLVVSRGTFTVQLPFRLRGEGFDLHYTRGTYIAFALVAAGLPTILETHRSDFDRYERFLLSTLADRSPLRGVVTLTTAGKHKLVDLGLPSEKIQVRPDAVSLDRYEPQLSTADARTQLDLSLPAERPVVAYTGSFEEGKGVRDLVRACAPLDVELLLVGGDEDNWAAMATFLEYENITNVSLVGRVPPAAVPRYQQAADVLALAPVEGVENARHHPEFTSPLKLFEYMAAGRPVVATALPGIEAVLEDGVTGLLVEPGEVDWLRNAIDRVTTDDALAEKLSERTRKAVKKYTWSRRARDILDAL